jgi:hypothetical protein
MSTSTTAKDASPIGSVVAVVILVGSLLLNFYLLRRPGSAQATASFSEPAKTKSAVATKPGAKPLETTAIADEADLETLRDTLLAAGA